MTADHPEATGRGDDPAREPADSHDGTSRPAGGAAQSPDGAAQPERPPAPEPPPEDGDSGWVPM